MAKKWPKEPLQARRRRKTEIRDGNSQLDIIHSFTLQT